MLRKGIAAALLASWLATPVQAGLLEAMTTALTGLQTSETVIPLGASRQGLSYEDLRFIDPVTSTRTNAVYRNGPELEYDPLTGGVIIIAPPLLGPADEFGIRQTFSPKAISIRGGNFLSGSSLSANISLYSRHNRVFNGLILPPTEDGSFRLTSQTDHLLAPSLNGRISFDINSLAGFSGNEIHVPSLLATGLGPEFYDEDLGFLPEINLWPTGNGLFFGISYGREPDVNVAVHYGLSIYRGNVSFGGYSFLAVPKVIPEPGTSLLVLMASAMLLSYRTRQR